MQRIWLLHKTRLGLRQFTARFASIDMNRCLIGEGFPGSVGNSALARIFHVGVQTFRRVHQQSLSHASMLSEVERAMHRVYAQEEEILEKHLPFLASAGSISPYIGLFGTVWGIMMAFHALGNASQVSIANVAPGISEALIATAMGLFAAIPAVWAYNRYSQQIAKLLQHYETFQDDFMRVVEQQLTSHTSRSSI